MTDKPLDYSKLTTRQRERIDYACRNKHLFKHLNSLRALARMGWLVEDEITKGVYRLTIAGREARDAYFAQRNAEAAQQPAATASNPLREVRVYRDFSIRQGKAEYLAYRQGEEKWSLRAKTITELKELIDCLIDTDAEAAQQPAADASAPVLCLNCGQPANRGDFALCWDCEYDFRSAASDEPPPAADASAPDDLDEQERQHYTSKHWRSIHNPQTGERQQVHAGATEIINALLNSGWQWDEPPPVREADGERFGAEYRTDSKLMWEGSHQKWTYQEWLEVRLAEAREERRLLNIAETDKVAYSARANKAEAQLAASQERERDLRAALEKAAETVADICGILTDNIEHYDNLYPDEVEDALIDLQRRADQECERIDKALSASEEAK